MDWSEEERARLWSYIDKTADCWLWKKHVGSHGYGQFVADGKKWLVHRAVYTLCVGPIPKGLCVLHDCDKHYPAGDISYRRCCNPAHLWLGTRAENSADMVAKGRAPAGSPTGPAVAPERRARGDRNGSRLHPESRPRGDQHHTRRMPETVSRGEESNLSRLTADKVVAIRQEFRSGMTITDLGRRYGVTKQAVSLIVNRKNWKHLP